MTPELRHLRYFVAMAEHLSFTVAARELHIAQQSLSQQIAALEHALGGRLFDRDTRGTRLTEVGRMFLPEARAVLTHADAALETARRAVRGEIGRLRVALLISTAHPARDRQAVRNLLGVAADLAASVDLTEAG
ncbi:LysR family transcriptional regulator [Microbispora hainanensis]|uniref:LysR family transcriptional regulator n=1 Tax=Microbispora hainanensis TaxID=568844 RepID=UPI0032557795